MSQTGKIMILFISKTLRFVLDVILIVLQKEGGGSRSEDDITLILIVTVLVFVICQTPALITQILISLLPDDLKRCPSPFFYYERVSDFMVVVNSSINFLIYCFCSRRFRQILLGLVGCGRCGREWRAWRGRTTVWGRSPENSAENGHTVGASGRNHLKVPNRSITKYTTIHASPKEVKRDMTEF